MFATPSSSIFTVQEACWSDRILRKISSAYTVNRYCGCCRCVLTFHCFPSLSILCHFDPSVVVLYFISFRLFSFLWLEEVVYFIFPSLFWSSHVSVSLVLGAEDRVPFLRLSLPIVRLVTMQVSLPIAISFSCVFQASMRFWLHSSFSTAVPLLLFLCPIFFFNVACVNLFIGVFHECRCLGRNLCLNCYPLQFLHLSFCGLLFRLLISSSFLLGRFCFLCFLFVWTMKRSILR